jgi:2-methylcitrate dehydratase
VTPAAELHAALGGKTEDIEKIEIETYLHAVECSADTRDKWNPVSRETADHSLPYCVAVTLANGSLWVDDFLEERIRDPKIHALMQKIEVRVIDEFNRAWPEAYPFRITVTTRPGQRHVREIFYAKGHPKNPMSDQEIAAKFRKLSGPVLDSAAIEHALSALWQLDSMKSVAEIFDLFVVDSSRQ